MKILVLDNKIKVSINTRLKNVVKWFNSDFQFTIKKTSFKNFPTQEDIDSNGNKFTRISDEFYDTNIVDKNYDCVILLVDKKDWVSGKNVQGYRTHNNLGVQEIVAMADNKSSYTFNGVKYKGDQLTWILIHELLHALYSKENKLDNTHKYFLESKPEKCLEDFKVESKVILTRLNDNGIQTTGVFDAYNNGKNMVCYSLELPWKDNKRNISAIPKGTYKCTLYNSTKYSKVYKVLDVKGRTNILIHAGNYNKDTQGCILLGNDLKDINKDGQKDVINSRLTLSKFMLFMGGKDFTLTIK